jgi:hypothetical protein
VHPSAPFGKLELALVETTALERKLGIVQTTGLVPITIATKTNCKTGSAKPEAPACNLPVSMTANTWNFTFPFVRHAFGRSHRIEFCEVSLASFSSKCPGTKHLATTLVESTVYVALQSQ